MRLPFSAKKHLGQNFLTNPSIVKKIIEAAEIQATDTVVEIGPGFGILTQALAEKTKKVISIEKDERFIPILQKKLQNNVEIIHGDALQYLPKAADYLLVANIPYSITSPLLNHFIMNPYLKKEGYPPKRAILMIQREVAKKLCAKPPDMNVLALHIQTCADVEYLFTVKKGSFRPIPQVDSAVVKIIPLSKPRVHGELHRYFETIHRAFSQKRKQLKKSLGIPDTRRPQELSIEEWDQYCNS